MDIKGVIQIHTYWYNKYERDYFIRVWRYFKKILKDGLIALKVTAIIRIKVICLLVSNWDTADFSNLFKKKKGFTFDIFL